MKVLVIIKKSPIQRYLINLLTEKLINEVKELIDSGRHSKAIMTAITKGSFEREVLEDEIQHVDADLILSENSARWDLTL